MPIPQNNPASGGIVASALQRHLDTVDQASGYAPQPAQPQDDKSKLMSGQPDQDDMDRDAELRQKMEDLTDHIHANHPKDTHSSIVGRFLNMLSSKGKAKQDDDE